MADKQLTEAELKELKTKMRALLAVNRQKLLLKYPFIGGVLMRMDLIPVRDLRVRTACTDGTNVYCDIAFWSELTEEEQEFVLAHETWHCVLMHFARLQNREPELFNIATDMEVNHLLECDNMKMPKDGVRQPRELNGKSAEECYEWLLQAMKKKGRKQMMQMAGLDKSGKNKNKDDSWDSRTSNEMQSSNKKLAGQFDKHIHKENVAEEEKDNRNQNGQGKNDSDNEDADGKDGKSKSTAKGGSGKTGTGVTDKYGDVGLDPDYHPAMSEATAEKIREAAISAAQQCERTQGTLPSHVEQIINEIKKPEIRWQEVLAQFVTSCYNGSRCWLPPCRRHIHAGLYLQSRRQERINVTVAIDTSSSTSLDLPKFMGELISLLNSFGGYELHLIQCDAEASDYQKFDDCNPFPVEDCSKFKFTGFGGTSFVPPFEYVKEHGINSDCFIYFTDGFGDAPANPPPYPVLWILTHDGNEDFCNWGRKLKFKHNDRQYNEEF